MKENNADTKKESPTYEYEEDFTTVNKESGVNNNKEISNYGDKENNEYTSKDSSTNDMKENDMKDAAGAVKCESSYQGNGGNLWGNIKITDGSTIQCYGSEGTYYRWTDSVRRIYPTEGIAQMWDPYYTVNVHSVDCTDINEGVPMEPMCMDNVLSCEKASPNGGSLWGNPRIPDGSSIECYGSEGTIYRWANGERRVYPSEGIGRSWHPGYDESVQQVDCTDITEGAPMAMKCKAVEPTCEFISVRGGDLWGNPVIPDGSSIQCYGSEGTIYRWTRDMRRVYSSDAIGRSWDPQYDENVHTVDCTDIFEGAPMPPKCN